MSQEEIFARGKLFELVHLPQDDGRVFEVARRAPGIRLIIPNHEDRTLLLTKEFRRELNAWDFRLPGGKVFDSLDEFEAFRASSEDIAGAGVKKAVQEAREEAGVDVSELKLFKKSTLGATVEWDLFVYEVMKWSLSENGQDLEAGEQIEAGMWIGFEELKQMVLNGDMQEERIALILLQWLEKQGVKL